MRAEVEIVGGIAPDEGDLVALSEGRDDRIDELESLERELIPDGAQCGGIVRVGHGCARDDHEGEAQGESMHALFHETYVSWQRREVGTRIEVARRFERADDALSCEGERIGVGLPKSLVRKVARGRRGLASDAPGSAKTMGAQRLSRGLIGSAGYPKPDLDARCGGCGSGPEGAPEESPVFWSGLIGLRTELYG